MTRRKLVVFAATFLVVATGGRSFADEISLGDFENLAFRHIGPEGNRTIAAAGVSGDPNIYYIGAASGGLWKTDDGGFSWHPVFDDQDVASIGAVAVAPSDPNIVWAGTGETNVRSSISIGNGIYKSDDGGQTWQHMGLRETARIGRIVIHPDNPDIVYVAALGTIYGPQEERGIYKTTDGGKSWERSLFTDPNTGGMDITLHPNNPDTLIAGMWPISLKTWERKSGGPNGGLYMTTDAGDNWRKLTKGLPQGDIGKVAVSYARSDPEIVYALIETDQFKFDGVLWRSDDGGENWQLVSYDQEYITRPHYYTRIVVAPDNPDEFYTLASNLSISKDGGKTSETFRELGGDEHDLWIDPENPDRMIGANDQTVRITTNRGKSWYFTALPIAQMYHVAVDEQIPYFVYGNRQDGPTYRIPSNSVAGGRVIGVGGGEAGFTFADPFDNSIIWASNEQGVLERFDTKSGQSRNVQVWPETPVGRSPRNIRYRWIWSYPFILSSHKQNTLYAGSQFVHRTTDGGENWDTISPDLTLNDPAMQVNSGGLTYDNVGVDYGNTLYALAESPLDARVLWAGSNDGLLHVTRDGGEKWTNVTENLEDLPKLGTVTSIEASPHDEATAYVTIDLHQVNDRSPYIYKTKDYGRTWSKITNGIPESMLSYAQIVREDLVRPGLLYAGTENALYVSFDDGANWQKFNNGLPPAPYRWIALQEGFGDLVAGTYGRGFWILDDLTPIREATAEILAADAHLFSLRATYRFQDRSLPGGTASNHDQTFKEDYFEDPEYGVPISYSVNVETEDRAQITVRDASGSPVRVFDGPTDKGLNRVYWNLKHEESPPVKLLTPPPNYPAAARVWLEGENNEEGWRELDAEGSGPNGPLAVPGTYTVEVIVAGVTLSQNVEIRKDPLSTASEDDIEAQIRLALQIRDRVTELTKMGNSIERIRKQLDNFQAARQANDDVKIASEKLEAELIELEAKLYLLNATGASENLLRFPSQLYTHFKMLGYYVMTGDARPTGSKYDVYDVLAERLRAYEADFEKLIENQLSTFNEMLDAPNQIRVDIEEDNE